MARAVEEQAKAVRWESCREPSASPSDASKAARRQGTDGSGRDGSNGGPAGDCL